MLVNKYLLFRTQRNEILQAVSNAGLDPTEFEWREVRKDRIPTVADEAIVSSLVHTPTGYQITFDMRGRHKSVAYSPGQQSAQDHEICGAGWVEVHHNAKEWTGYLKRELDAPEFVGGYRTAAPASRIGGSRWDTEHAFH